MIIGVMGVILVERYGWQEKNKKKYIKGVENPYRLYYYYSVTREKIKKGFDSMMEVGIFRKKLHEIDMINNGMTEYIGAYNWVDVADGREVVFENSVEPIGFMTMVNKNGKPVELAIFREWCNDFKPLSDL